MNRLAQARAFALQAEILALAATDGRYDATLAADAGVHRNSLRHSRTGASKRGMTLLSAVSLLDAMGYELRIVEKPAPTLSK